MVVTMMMLMMIKMKVYCCTFVLEYTNFILISFSFPKGEKTNTYAFLQQRNGTKKHAADKLPDNNITSHSIEQKNRGYLFSSFLSLSLSLAQTLFYLLFFLIVVSFPFQKKLEKKNGFLLV